MEPAQSNVIEIIDKNGWSKTYPLPAKPIIHLGSHAENDIILTNVHGTGVAPLHAQIIAPGANRPGYQLVNLSETEIILNTPEAEPLPSRTATVVIGGSSFTLGEFTLILRGKGGYFDGLVGRRTANIGLQLNMPRTQAGPGQAFDATVLIQNLGQKTGVQFNLELEGLDDECFDLEPGPLLSSGAGKEMKLRIYHRGPKPAAGDCRVMVRAKAPYSYPGEIVAVTQTVKILPYYRHRLGLLPPDGSGKIPQPDSEELLPKAKTVLPPQPSASSLPYQAGGIDWWGEFTPKKTITDAPPAPETTLTTPVKESADWWSSPANPAEQENPTTGPVNAAAAAATIGLLQAKTDSANWWSTPQETPSLSQTQTGKEVPAAKTKPQTETADWWSTPPKEAAPGTSPIPPTTDVPRQADDWRDPESAAVQPPQSDFSSDAGETTGTIPTLSTTSSDEWWATDSGPAPVPFGAKVEEITEPPAKEIGHPAPDSDPPFQDFGKTSETTTTQAGRSAATTAPSPSAPPPPVSTPQPAAEIQPPPQPEQTGDETLVSAAAPQPEIPKEASPSTPAEPRTQATVPPLPEEKNEEGGGLWSTMKAGMVGMAVAMPFISRKSKSDEPHSETDAEAETLPHVSATESSAEGEVHEAHESPEETPVTPPPSPLTAQEDSQTVGITPPQTTPPPVIIKPTPPKQETTEGPLAGADFQQDKTLETPQDDWWTDEDAWKITPKLPFAAQTEKSVAPEPADQPALTPEKTDESPARDSNTESFPDADNWWHADAGTGTGAGIGTLHRDEDTTDTWGQKDSWPPLVPGAETASKAEDWWSAEVDLPPKSKDNKKTPPSGEA